MIIKSIYDCREEMFISIHTAPSSIAAAKRQWLITHPRAPPQYDMLYRSAASGENLQTSDDRLTCWRRRLRRHAWAVSTTSSQHQLILLVLMLMLMLELAVMPLGVVTVQHRRHLGGERRLWGVSAPPGLRVPVMYPSLVITLSKVKQFSQFLHR